MSSRASHVASAIAVVALIAGACGSSTATSSTSVLAAGTPTPSPTVTATPTPRPTPTATSIPGLADAEHVVSRLDDLTLLFANGDADAIAQWGNDEGTWITSSMANLLNEGVLSTYPENILALLSAVAAGQDQTEAIHTLLATRNDIASTFRLARAEIPAATPVPTPAPTPKSVTYAKLTARNWAKIVKAPDNYVGKGYQVWACIFQFDAATGSDSFLAHASFKRQEYWGLYGENTAFTGDEDMLSNFVENDIVVMNVISAGSYSYDTQAGGNTTVPSFQVTKITNKGSCE
jgi:hypothetical protein